MNKNIKLAQGDTIVFTGDSITDCCRTLRPYAPYGNGYVHFAANMLLAGYPELGLKIVNSGISGNTTSDLLKRWDTAVLRHQPDILSVLIGVNDVWRSFDSPDQPDLAVDLTDFEKNYRTALDITTQSHDCQLILAEPFMFCDDPENEMFKKLRKYIEIVGMLAKEYNAVLLPLQTMITEKLSRVSTNQWSDDMVHPFTWAHAWIADKWLYTTGL